MIIKSDFSTLLMGLRREDIEQLFPSEASNSLWQDELCLQPLKSYPGFSQLCNLCIQVFREIDPLKSKSHVEFLSTLEESARRGCRLCNLLLEWFREEIRGKTITRVSLSYQQVSFQWWHFKSPSKQHQYFLQILDVGGKSQ